jgi:hypothetical protein
MKRIALTFVALLGLAASAAHAQERAQHRYVQRTDHYAQVFNYWASFELPHGFNPGIVYGGSGIVVGTRIRCNVCGTVGHYSCGAAVPLYVTHYTWDMMP